MNSHFLHPGVVYGKKMLQQRLRIGCSTPWAWERHPSAAPLSGVGFDITLRFLSDLLRWPLACLAGLWLLFPGNCLGAQTPHSAQLYESMSPWEQAVLRLSAVTSVPVVDLVPGAYVSLEKWI